MRQRFALALLILLVPFGCDKRQQSQGVFVDGAPATIELELWTWALRPWFDDYMADLLADFHAKHPNIRVHWVDIPGDALTRKFFAAGAAGRLPDVVNLPDKQFMRFSSLGGLMPLDDLLPDNAESTFVQSALDACRIDGKLMALPWYLSTEMRVMNTRLLAEGGLSPQTLATQWRELLVQARSFRAATGKYLIMTRVGDVDLLGAIIGEQLPVILPHDDGGYRSNMTDPRIVEYVSMWAQAYRDNVIPSESATAEYPQLVAQFKEQQVAVINANAIRDIKNQSPHVYEHTQVGPAITGSGGEANIAAVVIAVSSQSRHPKEAALLAMHICSPVWQEKLAIRASRLPSTASSYETNDAFKMPDDVSGLDQLQLATAISGRQIQTSARSFIQPIGSWPDLEKVFAENMKRALTAGGDVRSALGATDREWNRILRAEAAGLPYR